MRVLLVNQFGPPDDAPTAQVVGHLAEAMLEGGHRVEVVATRRRYAGSRRGWRRWAEEAAALAGLGSRVCLAPKPDRIVALSSPPALIVPVACAAGLRGVPLVHWIMDLYPETAIALGEVRAGSPVAEIAGNAITKATRRCVRVFALDRDMAARLAQRGITAEVLPLWPLEAVPEIHDQTPDPVWLYSGNLGRAHEWETLLETQRLLESTGGVSWRLVFQAGGAEIGHAKERAQQLRLREIEFRPLAARAVFAESLQRSAVLIVTQRTQAKGCVWPSKLAVAARVRRPLLWVGATDGAVAEWVRDRPATGIFAPGDAAGIADWLRSVSLPESCAWQRWLDRQPVDGAQRAAKALLS